MTEPQLLAASGGVTVGSVLTGEEANYWLFSRGSDLPG